MQTSRQPTIHKQILLFGTVRYNILTVHISGLIRRGDLVVGKPDDTKIAETPAEKYSAWLKQIFEEAW